ncbi:Oidioi.mRNA.OKI2018_I69.chr2.g7176.t1.cds [Oikopleura dioica]|uniref:Oidioi.mRNA.OKI2018_I69.chr2.g7176.t1.cds n=1 Tax=Oikopleura dioica TaxID=34765 RepID=A0ABN7T7N7_OIKDI|nr:Oidioi.mRNA.OKI2018_I69.chr2.g7176.t1.cds [Oikopleura dioica]
MKIAAFLLFAASEAYPPADIENPGESKTCANEVAEDDCVRLFVAKNYSCESFTKEQQKACQGTCNKCYEDPTEAPPTVKVEITTVPPTLDDFVNQDNYVDEYNDAASEGILPDHGQNGVNVGYPMGYPYPGYPYPYPAGYPYPQAPGTNGALPPYMAQPTTVKPGKPTKKPPSWADENDKNETLNPTGAIDKDGKTNINVPVLASGMPSMLIPIWVVILIVVALIVLLSGCCWCSLKVHGGYLRRRFRNDTRKQTKEAENRIKDLENELSAMRTVAKEKNEQHAKELQEEKDTLNAKIKELQAEVQATADQIPSYEEASNFQDLNMERIKGTTMTNFDDIESVPKHFDETSMNASIARHFNEALKKADVPKNNPVDDNTSVAPSQMESVMTVTESQQQRQRVESLNSREAAYAYKEHYQPPQISKDEFDDTKNELDDTKKAMKDLQGMVRSLIGTVADQHDATEALRKKLNEKPQNVGPPAPPPVKITTPAVPPAPKPHTYENTATVDDKYGHLAPAQPPSAPAPVPTSAADKPPTKEFITPIHAYFKPGLPTGVAPAIPNVPPKTTNPSNAPPEFSFSEAAPNPPTRKFNKPDWDASVKVAPPKPPSVTSFERMHMELTKRHQEQPIPPQDFDTRSMASVATTANQTFISEVTSEYQAAVGKSMRDDSQTSGQYYENFSVSENPMGRSRMSSMTETSYTQDQTTTQFDSDNSQKSVVENSRATTRPPVYGTQEQVLDIPESRATMNNFINRIPTAASRDRFTTHMSSLEEKWGKINHQLNYSEPENEKLSKQMFSLGMDILKPNGTENIIEIGRKLGDLGTKLAAEDPRAGTLNTFTKNVLFTAIFMNKQPTGNEMFQTSYHSLLETADQMMGLLSQQFKDAHVTKAKPLASATFPAESIESGLTTSATTASSSSSSSEEEEEASEANPSENIEKTVDDLFNSAVASVPVPQQKANDENKEEEESSSDSFSTSSESEDEA